MTGCSTGRLQRSSALSFSKIVEHAGDLAAVLEKQFAVSLSVADPGCPECFEIEVRGGVRLLPEDVERPSWSEDPHRALADLTIVEG